MTKFWVYKLNEIIKELFERRILIFELQVTGKLINYIFSFLQTKYNNCSCLGQKRTFSDFDSSVLFRLIVLCSSLHHGHELFEVYLTVAVPIDFFQCLVDCFFRDKCRHVFTLKQCYDFLAINFATAIYVKHVECCPEVIFAHVNLVVQSCCYKL